MNLSHVYPPDDSRERMTASRLLAGRASCRLSVDGTPLAASSASCQHQQPAISCRYRMIPTPAVIPVYRPPSTATLPLTITYFIPVASSVGLW